MNIKEITIDSTGTHHLYDGKSFYTNRFSWVLKFHEPGLAPVGDDSGAYHITLQGEPLYQQRYQRTFGYYYLRSAVIEGNKWFHIDEFGNKVYKELYNWAGNYQENICPVRDLNGLYFHIDSEGKRLYRNNYLYAGDFKDGIAVIRKKNGHCTHIYKNGSFVHEKEFTDLDVFHKQFSRARDKNGWFHIDLQGNKIYNNYFSMIEPFYNGFAYVEELDGSKSIIDESGKVVHKIT